MAYMKKHFQENAFPFSFQDSPEGFTCEEKKTMEK